MLIVLLHPLIIVSQTRLKCLSASLFSVCPMRLVINCIYLVINNKEIFYT